ncbi:MAG TPA: ABC transporter permease [Vicinamibacterales bacterium]|nr:ABC transporter permease [Vicinamibacterales bacterium]
MQGLITLVPDGLPRDLLEQLNALPGIVSASAARVTVLSGTSRTVPVSADGQPMRTDRSNVIPARANVVSGRYLETMGIPLVRGRGFLDSDAQTSPRVAIVSRALANRLWGERRSHRAEPRFDIAVRSDRRRAGHGLPQCH